MLRSICAALFLVVALAAAPAQAHDARPLAVTVSELGAGQYRAQMHVPPSVELANRPRLEWPASCKVETSELTTSEAACPRGLRGQSFAVHYPGYNPSLATLFRLEELDGRVITQLLAPEQPRWSVPLEAGVGQVAWDYLRLGVAHIWLGLDHLLFVAGLLLLARTTRRIVWAVTGFTLAHSLTLALSTLGLVQVRIPAIEAVIALSILFVAREIAVPRAQSLAAQNPVLVSSVFGLLHGFGFAAALREIGLPGSELATGLLAFNIGVELGQLAFIALLLALYALVRFLGEMLRHGMELPVERLRLYAAYALGVPAAFWLAERMQPVLLRAFA